MLLHSFDWKLVRALIFAVIAQNCAEKFILNFALQAFLLTDIMSNMHHAFRISHRALVAIKSQEYVKEPPAGQSNRHWVWLVYLQWVAVRTNCSLLVNPSSGCHRAVPSWSEFEPWGASYSGCGYSKNKNVSCSVCCNGRRGGFPCHLRWRRCRPYRQLKATSTWRKVVTFIYSNLVIRVDISLTGVTGL